MKTLATIVFLLHFIPAFFSYLGYDAVFYFLFEAQFLLACLAVYFLCPARQWRLKLIWFVSCLCAVGFFIHNTVIIPLIDDPNADDTTLWVYSTFFILFCASLIMGMPLVRHWDRLPNDKIEVGKYYEIIGKPRTDLQFLLFMLTGGRGGSYAITDGTHIIKMSKAHNQSILLPFSEEFLIGKKCLEIGGNSGRNQSHFLSKIGIDFSFLRSCYWLSRGFEK